MIDSYLFYFIFDIYSYEDAFSVRWVCAVRATVWRAPVPCWPCLSSAAAEDPWSTWRDPTPPLPEGSEVLRGKETEPVRNVIFWRCCFFTYFFNNKFLRGNIFKKGKNKFFSVTHKLWIRTFISNGQFVKTRKALKTN